MGTSMKHIHILGICGTFMAGIAVIAKQLGYKVTGSDANVYPPMSTFLAGEGITLMQGYDASHLQGADCVVVGNAMKRGNSAIEHMLNKGLNYVSGPEWLANHVLHNRWVLAVAGTHGKTTTSSMLAWILEHAGMQPGFLIGGIPNNFNVSARVGGSDFFVIEADEYDTAFFDKRSKFVHYRPRTLILNNLEFDHADIFPDVSAIQKQFHHLIRTVPSEGLLIENETEPYLTAAVEMGYWTPREKFAGSNSTWQAQLLAADGSRFIVLYQGKPVGEVVWQCLGQHNVNNALAAIAAAHHVGVTPEIAIQALAKFNSVKRRMELRGVVNDITVYDDFAHHPTAIETTLLGLKNRINGKGRIWAVLEPRSNTMRMGSHVDALRESLKIADKVSIYEPSGLGWNIAESLNAKAEGFEVFNSVDSIVAQVASAAKPGDHIVVMSNGGFENIHTRMLQALKQTQPA
jgi:UDP-N-acetylmuramate: L-alanyl-gamma-D-glutamyl-meso-diaminopimelate ligase